MLINEKISRLVKQALNEMELERETSFINFLVSEFSRTVTRSELHQAIIGWSEQYMDGNNDGDFEGVAKYLDWDTYVKVVDQLPELFKKEIEPYLNFEVNGKKEER